jgi:2-methylisocitrate lyase-like PEP mutase family enzyme
MPATFEQFKQLHNARNLFILPNAWDAKSARLLQNKQYAAVGTSSAAVAESLGYNDGEQMSFTEYLFVIKRILASVSIPVTIDMEMGYGNNDQAIVDNLLQLADLGVAGVNLEDSFIQNGRRSLKKTEAFARTVEFIKKALLSKNSHLFVNARCDTYILNVANKQQETAGRLQAYEAAGADGIFLPLINQENDIAEAVQHTQLPINVMCMPGLPSFSRLQQLGVRRVSMGPFLFSKTYQAAETLAAAIKTGDNCASIL